jgi:polyisoprenoid-binding protein YceI
MNRLLLFLFISITFVSTFHAQNFKVKANGTQTFNLEDTRGRNQITFFSATPLEDITGTASGITGTVSFDPTDFSNTLKGKIIVKIASMKTGIDLRDQHLRSSNWLDAEKYPDAIFEIISVSDLKQTDENKLEFKVKGNFTFHGVTKEIIVDSEAAYLEENEQTQKRAPGDLLGVRSKFNVRLSEYGVNNQIIGNKVAENIEVSINIVGSNK